MVEWLMVIKNIYTLFLGLMIVVFVGVGVDVFYPNKPVMPIYPESDFYLKGGMYQPTDEETIKHEEELREYQIEFEKYQERLRKYHTEISIVLTVVAVILVVISLMVLKKVTVLSDGVLFGGFLTQLYGVIEGFNADNNQIRFLVVTVGLAVLVTVGYVKFVKEKQRS